MENVNLNHASLKHAYIYKTILANTEFTNVDASYSNFCGQDLTEKIFHNTNLSGANLAHTKMQYTYLGNAI